MAEALGAAGPIRLGSALGQDAARVHAALPAPAQGSHVLFAFDGDRRACIATLLATWAKGHAAALPADPRRYSVAPILVQPHVSVLAHDTGVGLGLDTKRLLATAPTAHVARLPHLPIVGPLTTYGLGVGGTMTSRAWTESALRTLVDDVVRRLELPEGANVWNAFRPANPAALVPGVLAPLQAGCAIVGGSGDDLVALQQALASHHIHTLVAPAALLRAFANAPAASGLALRQVVVADTTLDAATRERLACRSLRIVELPSLTAATNTDPRSLAVQHALLRLEGVLDAAVEAVDLPTGPQFFGAVQTTVRDPTDLLRSLPAVHTLHTQLRCMPRLPRDPDGQVARDVLLRWFGRAANGLPPSNRLSITPAASADDRVQFAAAVPSDFFAFDGHFPGYPVLSGAVQLHELVMPCLRLARGTHIEATSFHDLKFLARIAPGDTVLVALRLAANGEHADFEILRGAVRCSAGRVVLRAVKRESST